MSDSACSRHDAAATMRNTRHLLAGGPGDAPATWTSDNEPLWRDPRLSAIRSRPKSMRPESVVIHSDDAATSAERESAIHAEESRSTPTQQRLSRKLLSEQTSPPVSYGCSFTPLPTRRIESAVERLLDVVGASLLIVLLAPLLVVGALLVRIDSPGPIFFGQERVGKDLPDLSHLEVPHHAQRSPHGASGG